MNVWCVVFVTGQAQYPVERVLLTSGILTAAINCRYAALRNAGVPNLDIKTPQEVVRSRADTPCVVACGLPRVRYAALAATSVAASGGADVDVRRPHAATFAISTLVNVYCKQG